MLPSSTMDRILRIVIIVAIIIAAGALGLGTAWLLKGQYDNRVVEAARVEDNAAAQANMTIANTSMAAEQTADAIVVTTQREELRNAEIDRSDGLTARQRRGCIIMRQQNQDIGRDPTCRRLAVNP